jgi:hypothetical protein
VVTKQQQVYKARQRKARQGVYMCTRRKTNAEEGRAGTKVETVRSDDEEDAHMGRL